MQKILFLFLALAAALPLAARAGSGAATPVSWVDTSLDGAQKHVLRVDGRPWLMASVQVRLDLLRYSLGWTAAEREALVAQAAADGFNTISVPLHWREVEPEKDRFAWDILEEYLDLARRHGLRLELLWFGANSGGHVQWLSRSKQLPNQLRTPDYVLASPEPGSKQTTSQYRLRRDMSAYTLDMADTALCQRETSVLGRVMARVARWDKAHGHPHTLIGVQIDNEALGYGGGFANDEVLSYLNRVAAAVKQSDYVVWTRANCVFWNITARVLGNERRRAQGKATCLDFVGVDTYRHHFRTDADMVASMRDNVPYAGANYRMVMEANSERPFSALLPLAALSGNNAFSYYSIEGLYDRAAGGVRPVAAHVDDVRLAIRTLRLAPAALATAAAGYGLYVHNWQGTHSESSVSNRGVAFAPARACSQGVSVWRGDSVLVVMATHGGLFTLPDSLRVASATRGRYDAADRWQADGSAEPVRVAGFDSGAAYDLAPQAPSYRVGPAEAVRIVLQNGGKAPVRCYQAETARLADGARAEAETRRIGFAGNGYALLPATEGASVEWRGIDGGAGGTRTLAVRYAGGSGRAVRCVLRVNGTAQTLNLPDTGAWDTYRTVAVRAQLAPGAGNTVSLESLGNYRRDGKVVVPLDAACVDELQVGM